MLKGMYTKQALDQLVFQQNVPCNPRPCAPRSTKPDCIVSEAPKIAFIARIVRVRISAKAVC